MQIINLIVGRREKKKEQEEKDQTKKNKLPPNMISKTYLVDKDTEDKFRTICNEKGTTSSAQLRKMMEEYVEQSKEDAQD